MSEDTPLTASSEAGPVTSMSAADALQFRELLLGWWAHRRHAVAHLATWRGCTPHRSQLLVDQLGRNLLNAEISLWRLDIWKAAVSGAEAAFNEQPLRLTDYPHAPQLWLFQQPVDGVPDSEYRLRELPKAYRLRGFLTFTIVHPDNPTQRGMTYGEIWLPQVSADALPAFRFFAPLYQGQNYRGVYCSLAGASRFMQSEYAGAEPVTLPRPVRRQAERDGRPIPPIHVVRLRRSSRKPGDPTTDAEARNYTCQWLVSGHWRKPDPRMKEPAPVYVRPHVKGPENLPLRTPRPTVNVVNR